MFWNKGGFWGAADAGQLSLLSIPQSSKENPATLGTLDQGDAVHRSPFSTAPRRKQGAEGVHYRVAETSEKQNRELEPMTDSSPSPAQGSP